MNARRLILVALCVAAGGLALSGAPAQAAFGPHLSQMTGTPSGDFVDACAVAVNPANQDVYVADFGNDAIDIFSSGGIYKSQISGVSVPSGPFTAGGSCAMAISSKTGDLYVADYSANVVYVFDSLGAWTTTMSGSDTPAGSFVSTQVTSGSSPLLGVAVEQASGRVDIADAGHMVIDRFDSENKYQSQFEPHTESFTYWSALTADSNGNVYLGESESGILKFDSSGIQTNFFYATDGSHFPPSLSLTVDPSENLYVGGSSGFLSEYDSSDALLDAIYEPSVSPVGSALNASGDLYIASIGSVEVLGPAGGLPEVETGAVSSVTGVSASIAGTVNPDGAATTYQFEYGPSPALGSASPASPESVGSDSSVHPFTAELTGLVPGATYYYRIAATNATGVTYGKRVSFTTPLVPGVVTGEASGLTETSATIVGTANPESKATTYQFEYGTTTAYGSVSPVSPGSVGSDTSDHLESAELTGLAPGVLYHYRIAATNSEGTSYGVDRTFRTDGPPGVDGESVAGITRTSAVVETRVNPDGFDTHVQVEYGTSEAYGSSTVAVDVGSGNGDQSSSFPLSGLQPGVVYHVRVVASNSKGSVDGADVTFTTIPPARIDGESFSHVGAAGAAVSAQVDDLGTPSTYYYEYGTSESYGSTTPPADLGVVNGDVVASGQLSGLSPATVYHFRVVVVNETGTARGADVTFRTLSSGILGLPDGRVYELVTSQENGDIDVPDGQNSSGVPGISGAGSRRPFQAAANGDTVTYTGDPVLGGLGGFQYLATRSPQGGWTQLNIQPTGYLTAFYEAFSSDLSVGVLQSGDAELPPLVSGAPGEGYKVLYTRTSDGSYRALFTATPPNRKPDEFVTAEQREGYPEGLDYDGASSDFSHVLFEANDALTSAAEVQPPGVEENDLYDSANGQLYMVNVLPDGTVAPHALFGTPNLLTIHRGGYDVDHVISTDGSRVFWTDLKTGDLYVRENDDRPQSPLDGQGRCTAPADACTVQVDASQNPGVVGGGGSFWTASGDGSKVFFTDCKRLTLDSTAVAPEGCDLYEYDVASSVLRDLTVDNNASDVLGASVKGVVGASEDGEYVYFVATGDLAAGASAGNPNLYVTHGGVVTFITSLSFADRGVWQPSLANRSAEVTPDGRSVVFAPASGEVYLYNAVDGHLVCVSCSPSMAVSGVEEHPVAGATGGGLPVDPEISVYQARWVSADGSRVFFDSTQALVAQDVNGVQDVYEWERDGSGSCRESPGCVYLLSGGTSSSWSSLLDASVSGDDVFVITRARLLTEDENENFDVFDARVGGAPPPVSAACSGTGCQGVPSAPPVFATPSSATFNGAGNFPASKGPVAKAKAKAKGKAKAKARAKKGKRRRKGRKGRRAKAHAKRRAHRAATYRGTTGYAGRSGR